MEDAVEIPIANGFIARVDSNDATLVRSYHWRVRQSRPRKDGTRVYYAECSLFGRTWCGMPNLILGIPPSRSLFIDHQDGDGLNNTRENLRVATRSQNLANQQRSGTKGVRYTPYQHSENPWKVGIGFHGRHVHLGYFPTSQEAAMRYNVAARKYFGEFARLNPVEMG